MQAKAKRNLIAIILVLSILCLAGCSDGNQPTSDGNQPTSGGNQPASDSNQPANEIEEDDEGVITLKLAHFLPANHPIETDLVQPWAQAVKEATKGRVKIESYPDETLATADYTYESVTFGGAHAGISCFSYTRERFPVLEVFELPGMFYNSPEAASKIAWEGVQMLAPKEIWDTTLLMVFATGPAEATDYTTMEPYYYNTLFFFAVNTEKWESISLEDRQTILGISDRFFYDVSCRLWDKEKVNELSDAEKELWAGPAKLAQDDYVSRMDKLGLPGQEILDSVLKLIEQYK